MPAAPVLAHTRVTLPATPEPARLGVFLHGILGSGGNWRTLARRAIEGAHAASPDAPAWGAELVDLRNHGRSLGFAPPHTLAACVGDLEALRASFEAPVELVLGHSFGGKVVLAWLAAHGEALVAAGLRRAIVVDSVPGAGASARASDVTRRVVDALVAAPAWYPDRAGFSRELTHAGLEKGTVDWLAMNVGPAKGEGGQDGFAFKLDLDAIRALLRDYLEQDLWSVVESPPAGLVLDVVVGGRSEVLSADDRARLRAAESRAGGGLRVTEIAEAGHWVHVDAPDAMLAVLLAP